MSARAEDRARRAMPSAAEVKARISPADFYRQELPTMPAPKKDRGWVPAGKCPFHDDHRPTNFRVNLTTGQFICFSCGSRGDVFAFLQMRYALTFREALRTLAAYTGARA